LRSNIRLIGQKLGAQDSVVNWFAALDAAHAFGPFRPSFDREILPASVNLVLDWSGLCSSGHSN
jgi:hypothetical protein